MLCFARRLRSTNNITLVGGSARMRPATLHNTTATGSIFAKPRFLFIKYGKQRTAFFLPIKLLL